MYNNNSSFLLVIKGYISINKFLLIHRKEDNRMKSFQVMLFSLIILIIAISGPLHADAAKMENIDVYLEGTELYFDNGVYIQSGRTLVEFRAIFEELGLSVSYDAKTKSVKGVKEGLVIELTVNSKQALVNGKPQTMDVAAQVVNGRTFVPLRFISEAAGIQVKWVQGSYFREIYLLDPNVAKRTLEISFGNKKSQFSLPIVLENDLTYEARTEKTSGMTAYAVDFYYRDTKYIEDNVWLLAVYKVQQRDWDQFWSYGVMQKIATSSDGWVYVINTPGEDPYMFGRYPVGSEQEYMRVHYHLKHSIIATLQ